MNKVYVNLNVPQSNVDRKLFGHFCEHAFGNIYGGIYDPGNPLSDGDGFRTDVLEVLRQVRVPILRYPGGNFVSNYHWQDGVGPKEGRRRVFEYAWLTEESNQFGTADFIKVCKKLGAEPLICVNMGTGTVEEAMQWVEYCNGTGNTHFANLRRQHGYEEPFGVKYWGLGNEMYGPWQMNYMTGEQYADKAFEFAKAMKWVDSSIRLVACGYEQVSDWNIAVSKRLWQLIDYVSAHHYACGWGPFDKKNYLETMTVADYMEKLNKLTCAAITAGMNDYRKNIRVAWDEWNMHGWLIDGINEDATYDLQNALITATVLNMFIRNSDTIGMANYSTFVNINGAVSVHPEGIVKRAQYHVFDLLSNHTGRTNYRCDVVGETFQVHMPRSEKLSRPAINLDLANQHPEDSPEMLIHTSNYLDVAVTGNDDGTLFASIVNKHPEKDLEVELRFDCVGVSVTGKSMQTIAHEDIHAANTRENPDNVAIAQKDAPAVIGNVCRVTVGKHSVNLLTFAK